MRARVRRTVKSFAERALGVHISRQPPPQPYSKHADQTLRHLRRWSSQDVVFDIGANDGRTILRLQPLLSSPRIFAFEPVAATYATLVRRTAHLRNVRTFPLAVGAAPGRGTMYLSAIDAMSSFSPTWTTSPAGTESVEVTTIDCVMAEQEIDFVHFLKVDTEGYELEVLRGAERALSESRVAIVQLEVGVDQLAKRMLSLEEARQYLASRRYYLYGIYNQCVARARPPAGWPPEEVSGYEPQVLAYCDALFVRADLP